MPRLASPFTASGAWFRGNLHVHTTNSDGSMPPEKLVAHYEHAGWDFLALTDHWTVSRVDQDRFPHLTVIPGIEVNTAPRSTPAGTNYHIVGLDMEADVPRKEGLMGTAGAQWLVDAIREQGGVAIVAHPYWSGLTVADVEGLRDHLGLEVYNADTEVHIGRGNSQVLWDDLLTRGRMPLGVAVDDSHRPGQDSLRAWTVVRAPDRDAGVDHGGPAGGALLRLLRAGDPGRHLGAPGRRRPRRRRRAGGGDGHRALQPGPLDHPGGQRHQRGPAQRRALRDGPPRPAPRPRRDGRRAPPASPPGRSDRRRPAHRGRSSPSPGRRPTPGCR